MSRSPGGSPGSAAAPSSPARRSWRRTCARRRAWCSPGWSLLARPRSCGSITSIAVMPRSRRSCGRLVRRSSAQSSRAAMTRPIILALPQGRILDEPAAVFARAGYDLSPVLGDSRRLVHDCGPLRVLVLRSSNVATYVAHGAADVGVAGSDVLDEEGRDLFEPLDLGIGRCRMIVAERAEQEAGPLGSMTRGRAEPPPSAPGHHSWDELSDRAP